MGCRFKSCPFDQMKEPEYILENGTRVKVHDNIGGPAGIFVKQEILDRRTPGISGQICGFVPGHGGDVNGEENTGSAYGWWEFELEEEKEAP